MSFLIIGGAGFIGSNLAKYLAEKTEDKIHIIDNLSSGKKENLSCIDPSRISLNYADIINDSCSLIIEAIKPKVIFLMASEVSVQKSILDPVKYFKTNVYGTSKVMESAKKTNAKVIFSSSSSVYGNSKSLPNKEEYGTNPISPYAITKVSAENIIKYYANSGVECCALRYFNVYGPNQDDSSEYSGIISKFSKLKKEGITPTIYGDGNQTRDFTYVDDVVKFNYLVSQKKLSGEIFNVCYGKQTSLNDIVEAFGFDSVNYEEQRFGDIKYSYGDNSKIKKFTNSDFEYDIRKGLTKLLGG